MDIIVSVYENIDAAQRAKKAIVKAGVNEMSVEIYDGQLWKHRSNRIVEVLSEHNFDSAEVQQFRAAIEYGMTLIALRLIDSDDAITIFEECGSLEIDKIVLPGDGLKTNPAEEENQDDGQRTSESSVKKSTLEAREDTYLGERIEQSNQGTQGNEPAGRSSGRSRVPKSDRAAIDRQAALRHPLRDQGNEEDGSWPIWTE